MFPFPCGIFFHVAPVLVVEQMELFPRAGIYRVTPACFFRLLDNAANFRVQKLIHPDHFFSFSDFAKVRFRIGVEIKPGITE